MLQPNLKLHYHRLDGATLLNARSQIDTNSAIFLASPAGFSQEKLSLIGQILALLTATPPASHQVRSKGDSEFAMRVYRDQEEGPVLRLMAAFLLALFHLQDQVGDPIPATDSFQKVLDLYKECANHDLEQLVAAETADTGIISQQSVECMLNAVPYGPVFMSQRFVWWQQGKLERVELIELGIWTDCGQVLVKPFEPAAVNPSPAIRRHEYINKFYDRDIDAFLVHLDICAESRLFEMEMFGQLHSRKEHQISLVNILDQIMLEYNQAAAIGHKFYVLDLLARHLSSNNDNTITRQQPSQALGLFLARILQDSEEIPLFRVIAGFLVSQQQWFHVRPSTATDDFFTLTLHLIKSIPFQKQRFKIYTLVSKSWNRADSATTSTTTIKPANTGTTRYEWLSIQEYTALNNFPNDVQQDQALCLPFFLNPHRQRIVGIQILFGSNVGETNTTTATDKRISLETQSQLESRVFQSLGVHVGDAVCDSCERRDVAPKDLVQCGTCFCAIYCSKRCQGMAWKRQQQQQRGGSGSHQVVCRDDGIYQVGDLVVVPVKDGIRGGVVRVQDVLAVMENGWLACEVVKQCPLKNRRWKVALVGSDRYEGWITEDVMRRVMLKGEWKRKYG
ncbi:hypothetical protein BDR26DRAFT_857408 [Obelidium mucronatum]|nr:hypothetical protein BDR26DRAFT_857408 [Obelidium mucronatum]